MSRPLVSAVLLLGAVLVFAADAPEASVPYFTNSRDVTSSAAAPTNYFVIDEEIWSHARPDLADIRLLGSDNHEVPYVLLTKGSSKQVEEMPAKVEELGRSGDQTTFVLEMGENSDFNRVNLTIDTKNFVTQATVDGMDDLRDPKPVRMGPFTLYDFSKEHLGSNFALNLPDSRFRFLRVRVGKEISPADVKGASVANETESKALYTDLAEITGSQQKKHTTVLTWKANKAVPLDRVTFDVDGVNFMRPVHVEDEKGNIIASGQISRIKMQAHGRLVQSEDLSVSTNGAHSSQYSIVVENGDDAPLKIRRVIPQVIERRVYFQPNGVARLTAYYGDEKLNAPIYDYAKLFQTSSEAEAAEAKLGPGQHNTAYTGRPDERPWTDRHPEVLWAAMILAVAGFGFIALRSLKKA
jgi:hypothetical protein